VIVWPARVQPLPSAPPTLPAPMIAIRICAPALVPMLPLQPQPAGRDGPWRHVLKRGDFLGKYGK